MSLLTRIKVGFTVLVVTTVAAAGLFVFRSPAANNTGSDEERLTIAIGFSPGLRRGDHRVKIHATADGITVIDMWGSHSEYEHEVQLHKGSTLEVRATQTWGDEVECYITRADGLMVEIVDEDGPHPRRAHCIYQWNP